MSDRELDPNEIEEVLKPARKQSYDVPGTNKRKRFDPNIRTVQNWFKLPHTMHGECQVPGHDTQRAARDAPRMYYIDQNGLQMCRWCFVEARDITT